MADSPAVDLFIIGGGVNGAGLARDAAGRGLYVVLCEKDDLAEGTSSRSSKMVHGGLRYLEYYEFRLVREALKEREILMKNAPHIIWPLRFVLPHSPQDRPAWLVRLGLFIYDHLGQGRTLPGTRALNLHRDPEGAPILDTFARGFEYSDCWVDDARLVILNAIDAAQRGATILTRTRAVTACRDNGQWHITTENSLTGETRQFRAKALINAAGPWADEVLAQVAGAQSSRKLRLVKGSHIIVPKFWDGPHSYLVQNHDKRVIFINAYQGDKALIGTTDIAYDGRPEDVTVDETEVSYLLDAVNRYFKEKLRREDVIGTFSGVRALFDDGQGNPSAVTRDYVLDLDEADGPPLLNIFGGKITTFRQLAERGLNKLGRFFPQMGKDWTADAPLPGGDMDNADYDRFRQVLKTRYPWMDRGLRDYYGRRHGTRTATILGDAASLGDLGRHFGGQLYEVELRYLVRHEWALTAPDILWRRSKNGLEMSDAEIAAFNEWFDADMARMHPDRKGP